MEQGYSHGVRDLLPAASISSRTAPPECDSSPVLPITTQENNVLQCSTDTMDVLGTVHNSFDGAWKEMHVMLHFFTIPRIITFYDEGETKATHVLVCHGDHVATTTESSVILVGEVVIRRFHVLSPRPRKEEVKMRIPVKPTCTKPVTSERKWLFCLNVGMKWIRWVDIIGNGKEIMMMMKWILLRKTV